MDGWWEMEMGGDSFGGKSGKFWIPHGDVKEAVHVWLGQLLFYDKHLQIDLIDIYRTFHPKTADYNFFSSVHRKFSRIDHILGHKSSLGKYKKIEIVSSIFSDHNAMRLDINYRKKSVRNTNTWRLNNALLNNQEITEEIKKEIKKYLGKMTMKTQRPKTYGMQ